MLSVNHEKKYGGTPWRWSVLVQGVGGRRKIALRRQHNRVFMTQPTPSGAGCVILCNNAQYSDTFRAILCLIHN